MGNRVATPYSISSCFPKAPMSVIPCALLNVCLTMPRFSRLAQLDNWTLVIWYQQSIFVVGGCSRARLGCNQKAPACTFVPAATGGNDLLELNTSHQLPHQ